MYQAVIVDDEPYIAEGIKNAIDWSGFGFEIALAATNPLKALDYIISNRVHLLITDISMPDMDGVTLLTEAKRVNPLLSVIVLSAFDNFEYVRPALRHGAENYLLKPLDPDELTESISQIVRHIQEREELSANYGTSMLTFRSTFIEHWVKNSLASDDLTRRASLLGINLNAGNYTVAVFSTRTPDNFILSRFFNLLLSLLPGRFTAHFYFETPRQLVCILTALHPESETVSDLMDYLESPSLLLEFPIFYACGPTVTSALEVPYSYQCACPLLLLKYTRLDGCLYSQSAPYRSMWQKLYRNAAELTLLEYEQPITAVFRTIRSAQTARQCTISILCHLYQSLFSSADNLPAQYPKLAALLKEFPEETARTAEYEEYSKAFAAACFSSPRSLSELSPCVEAVIQAVHEFSDKDISLKTLAARLNMSPSYLGNLFRQQTGSYFNDYLTQARLQYAIGLITATDMKMKDIVEKAGFSSQTYFNRIFKQHYQVSPIVYRRRLKLTKLSGSSPQPEASPEILA